MEILKLNFGRLHNEEHFQYHTECNNLIGKYTASVLGIEADTASYTFHLADEKEALKRIRASTHTRNLADADLLRDQTYRGLYNMLKVSCTHFRYEVRQAGTRLMLIMDNFGDVASLPYDEESVSITHLLDDLEAGYSADLTLTGAAEWVVELRANNKAFTDLVALRYDEGEVKPRINMRATRASIDETYRRMAKNINALTLVNGVSAYEGFINGLNLRISHFNNLIALRNGRNNKDEGDNPPAAQA